MAESGNVLELGKMENTGACSSHFRTILGHFLQKHAGIFTVLRDRGRHINKQELWELIKRECHNFPDIINNEIVFFRVDNTVLYDIYYNEGTTSNEFLTDIC